MLPWVLRHALAPREIGAEQKFVFSHVRGREEVETDNKFIMQQLASSHTILSSHSHEHNMTTSSNTSNPIPDDHIRVTYEEIHAGICNAARQISDQFVRFLC